MVTVNTDLNPTKKYSFQTSPSGRTHPVTVKQFLDSTFSKEELITIDDGLGSDSNRLWSTYDGWNVKAYSALVSDFVKFIDKTQEISAEFIDAAMTNELSVVEAVESWFDGTELSIEICHHAQGRTGFLDIDILGIKSVKRVVIAMDVQQGDMFNIYYGESSKGGGTWNTDLVTTLNDYFNAKLSVTIDRNIK